MPTGNHGPPQHQAPYPLQSDEHNRLKHEDFSFVDSPFRHSAPHPFIGLPGHNPLYSQERGFVNAGTHDMSSASATPLGFLPINHDRERPQRGDEGPAPNSCGHIKLENDMETLETNSPSDGRRAYLGTPVWNTPDHNEGSETHVGLHAEDLVN